MKSKKKHFRSYKEGKHAVRKDTKNEPEKSAEEKIEPLREEETGGKTGTDAESFPWEENGEMTEPVMESAPAEETEARAPAPAETLTEKEIEELYADGEPDSSAAPRKKKKKSVLLDILIVILIGVFCFSAYKLISTLVTLHKESSGFEELRRQIKVTDTEGVDGKNDDSLPDYASLAAQNPDMIGWIYIPGTDKNYPVMYTPDDPEYYLHRNFEKEYSFSGTPFVDGRNQLTDNQIIVYGHRMSNGSMFHDLLNYEDESWFQQYPTFRFDSITEKREYQIIAVVRSKIYSDEEDVFKYYDYAGNLSQEEFDYYVSMVKSMSMYDTGVTATYGDHLVTLSTCDYYTEDGRLAIVGKLVES